MRLLGLGVTVTHQRYHLPVWKTHAPCLNRTSLLILLSWFFSPKLLLIVFAGWTKSRLFVYLPRLYTTVGNSKWLPDQKKPLWKEGPEEGSAEALIQTGHDCYTDGTSREFSSPFSRVSTDINKTQGRHLALPYRYLSAISTSSGKSCCFPSYSDNPPISWIRV